MKLTQFTISPSGQLVYKKTGRLAPSTYKFRKNTVYGADGRRIGSLSRKLTKTEAAKIAKAERNRTRRKAPKAPKRQGKPSRPRPSKAEAVVYGEDVDWSEFDTDEFPEAERATQEEFAQRVRDAALSVAPPWLQKRIRAFSTEALWKAYNEDAYIFELYFQYHSAVDTPHKSDISVWLYQFVTRIEQYMGIPAA